MNTNPNSLNGGRVVALTLAIALVLVLGTSAMAADRSRTLPARFAPQAAATTPDSTVDTPVAAAEGDLAMISLTLNLAVDGDDIDPDERRLRIIALLSNTGAAVEMAMCPALFFGGDARPIQGYGYAAGDGVPVCTEAYDHAPTLGLSLDAMQTGEPACPSPDPLTEDGDVLTVPGGTAVDPGRLQMEYEYLLADLGGGYENLPPDEVRKGLLAGEGVQVNMLTEIDAALAELVCVNGVDTFLSALPEMGVANLASSWRQGPIAAEEGASSGPTALWSPASFGMTEALATAQVELIWHDNLETPLVDPPVTHDPEPGTDFTLEPATFQMGELKGAFPANLPEGFKGEATVVVFDAGTGEEGEEGGGETSAAITAMSTATYVFVVDTEGPDIAGAITRRGDERVRIEAFMGDETSGLGGVWLLGAIDGHDLPSMLMDYDVGNFFEKTSYDAWIDAIDDEDVVGASILSGDASGNTTMVTLPVAAAGPDRIEECTSPEGTVVELDGSNSTRAPDDEAATAYLWNVNGTEYHGEIVDVTLPKGESDAILTLTDDRAFTGVDQTLLEVVDTTPPVIHDIVITPECMWPPNHKYVRFALGDEIWVDADDACDGDLDIKITHVASSQPDNGNGDGNTTHDAVFSDEVMCLRSERAGNDKNGRMYRVTFEVMDDEGQGAEHTAYVRVPHDQRDHDCPELDPSYFLDDADCSLEHSGEAPEYRKHGNRAHKPKNTEKAKRKDWGEATKRGRALGHEQGNSPN